MEREQGAEAYDWDIEHGQDAEALDMNMRHEHET